MNKNTIFKSLILIGLVSSAPAAFAQKPTNPYGKGNDPARTVTSPVVSAQLPTSTTGSTTGTTTVTNTATNTDSNTTSSTTTPTDPSPGVSVPGTTTTGDTPVSSTSSDPTPSSTTSATTPSATSVVVPGTSTSPGTLPGTSQVNGSTDTPVNTSSGGGKGHGGKKLKTPQPAPQSGVPTSATDATSSSAAATTSTPVIIMQDNGAPTVTPPLTTGTEVTGLKPSEWTQPITGVKPNTPTPPGQVTVPATTATTVAVPAVGGVQTAQKDEIQVKKSCEDEALKEVYRIMSGDQNGSTNNALAKMYELTAMRLAKKALAEGNVTLEGYTQKKITELEGYFKQSKQAGEVQNKIKAAYEAYGKSGDVATINKDLDAALARGKKACYWSSETHLWNNQVASYVLAMSAADPKSGLSDADAATIWAVEKIRKGAGPAFGATKSGNLLNITNRVANYLGTVQGKASTPGELDSKIAAQEKELNEAILAARTQAEIGLVACIEQQNPSCAECQAKAKAKLSSMTSSLDQVQRGLAIAVQQSQNVQAVSRFKARAGAIDFDIEHLSQNSVQKDPARTKGFDACGAPKVAGNSAPVKPQTPAQNSTTVSAASATNPNPPAWSVMLPPVEPAARDATYVAPRVPFALNNSDGTPMSGDQAVKSVKKATLADLLWRLGAYPDLCVKYHGCYDANVHPRCAVCAKGVQSGIYTKTKVPYGYKYSKESVGVFIGDAKVKLGETESYMDPKVHPELYAIDHLTGVPIGSSFQVAKDELKYEVKTVVNAVRSPAGQKAAKMGVKSMTGWYYTPWGVYDYYSDLHDLTK